MPGFTVKETAVAKLYAGAILQLAQSQGDVETLLMELTDLAAGIEQDTSFASFLSNPTIEVGARGETLEKLFRRRYTDLLVDALQVMNKKGRLGLIRAVVEAYRLLRDEMEGRVQVHVRSAAPLTESLRQRLAEVAGRRTGKEADLIESIDDSLIGGLVVQIGDHKLDASVAAKLDKLGDALLERASREIHSGRTHVEAAAGS